jgi:hypothetical protein
VRCLKVNAHGKLVTKSEVLWNPCTVQVYLGGEEIQKFSKQKLFKIKYLDALLKN